MDAETSLIISSWADNISLVLTVLCFLFGGLNPRRPVWGYPTRHKLALFGLFFCTLSWGLFRVIHEGIHRESGPREFHAVSLTYLGYWLYLWYRMKRPKSKEWKIHQVASALRKVEMLRFGRCTEEVVNSPNRRKGVPEVVIRRGAKSLPTRPKRAKYWRGTKIYENFHEDVGIYEVVLVQKELHKEKLDRFGTIEYMNADDGALEEAYRHFYAVVMRAVNQRRPSDDETRNAEEWGWDVYGGANNRSPTGDYDDPKPANGQAPKVEVDFRPFTNEWPGLPVEGISESANANDPRMIGRVARRIAADAVAYINDEENEYQFRTERQVRVLNTCLRAAAASVFAGGLREGRVPSDDLPSDEEDNGLHIV